MAAPVANETTSVGQASGNVVLTEPANVANSDVLVACVGINGGPAVTWTAPAGWATIVDGYQNTYNDLSSALFYKIITNAAGEPAS